MTRLPVDERRGPLEVESEEAPGSRLFVGLVLPDELSLKMQVWAHLKTFGPPGATARHLAQDLLSRGLAYGGAQACTERIQELLESMVNLPGYQRTEQLSGGRYRAVDLRDEGPRGRGEARKAPSAREAGRRAREARPVEEPPAPAAALEPGEGTRTGHAPEPPEEALSPRDEALGAREAVTAAEPVGAPEPDPPPPAAAPPSARDRHVFVGSRNGKIVEQLGEILAFGHLSPVLPVADGRIPGDMRSCFTAVMHLAREGGRLADRALIEIGAALALYGAGFIVLAEEGVPLPACLDGVVECRYAGSGLDAQATIALLKALDTFSRA